MHHGGEVHGIHRPHRATALHSRHYRALLVKLVLQLGNGTFFGRVKVHHQAHRPRHVFGGLLVNFNRLGLVLNAVKRAFTAQVLPGLNQHGRCDLLHGHAVDSRHQVGRRVKCAAKVGLAVNVHHRRVFGERGRRIEHPARLGDHPANHVPNLGEFAVTGLASVVRFIQNQHRVGVDKVIQEVAAVAKHGRSGWLFGPGFLVLLGLAGIQRGHLVVGRENHIMVANRVRLHHLPERCLMRLDGWRVQKLATPLWHAGLEFLDFFTQRNHLGVGRCFQSLRNASCALVGRQCGCLLAHLVNRHAFHSVQQLGDAGLNALLLAEPRQGFGIQGN